MANRIALELVADANPLMKTLDDARHFGMTIPDRAL